MKKYYYDLHIHSCLSPCGDNESTPNSIAGMGSLNGLDIMALTDHNTCKNCPAFFKAAERYGITPIAGMELTTSEEIHVVCLFETLEEALGFEETVSSRRVLMKNRTEIFGEQLIVDENDKVIGNDENLLIIATGISLDEVPELVKKHNGIYFPAHIDKESNSVIAVLGSYPHASVYGLAELHNRENTEKYSGITALPKDNFLYNSDAHYLWNINESEVYLTLPKDLIGDEIKNELFKKLRSCL